MVDTPALKNDRLLAVELSTATLSPERTVHELNTLPRRASPSSLISSALRELGSLVVATPDKEKVHSVCAKIAQTFVAKASSDELQQLVCRCRAHDTTQQIGLLTRLQADTRKEACRIAQTPLSAEVNAIALALTTMTPRARGEFIVEALGRDRLRLENPGNYERGIAAVIRLTSTADDTRTYLARMQPGILKKMHDRQLAAELALTAVAATAAIPTTIKEQARVVLRQCQLISEGLRAAVGSVITKLLTAAVERQREQHVAKETYHGGDPHERVGQGSTALTEYPPHTPPVSRLTAFFNVAESTSRDGIGSTISSELVAVGLALLAAAREEEQQRKNKELTLESHEREARERVIESILRNLNPAIDALLMQTLSQEDFLGPLPFRTPPEAQVHSPRKRIA